MKSVSAIDLRKHVGQLLDEAAAGERIVIERAGQPLCALVPLSDLAEVDPDRRSARQLAALDELRRLARQNPLPRGIDSAELIRQMREERTEQILRNVGLTHERRGEQ